MPIAIHDTYFNLYDEYEDAASEPEALKPLEKNGIQRLLSAKFKSCSVNKRAVIERGADDPSPKDMDTESIPSR